MFGPQGTEEVPSTAVTVTATPTVFILSPSAVPRSTAASPGTWRNAPLPSPPPTAVAPTTRSRL